MLGVSGTLLLVGITALGLALRIAGAQGGLWLDEAWSVLAAHDVGTPAGVFLGINHDNNHHLNSLWLQLVGMGAAPPVQRALSIATGTLAVPVAAAIALRRGRTTALVTALLFATSPILVTLGSEARGYAPMILALLLAVRLVEDALAGDGPDRRTSLALCVVIGLLAQLTMTFAVVALVGWSFLAGWEREGPSPAARKTVRLFAPALAGLGLTLALLVLAARASPTGFHFGSYEPFTVLTWLRALTEMIGYTVGYPVLGVKPIAGALALVILAPRLGATRPWFYRLAIVVFPAALAILQAANPGHARYYLLAGVALLLLLGEAIGTALARPGWRRWTAIVSLVAFAGGASARDVDLATNRRADPLAAIRAIQARAPGGASVAFDRETGTAVLRVAAAELHYPLTVSTGCPPFVFVDRFGGEAMPTHVIRCASTYRPIASARVHGMSGTHWTLYERRP